MNNEISTLLIPIFIIAKKPFFALHLVPVICDLYIK